MDQTLKTPFMKKIKKNIFRITGYTLIGVGVPVLVYFNYIVAGAACMTVGYFILMKYD